MDNIYKMEELQTEQQKWDEQIKEIKRKRQQKQEETERRKRDEEQEEINRKVREDDARILTENKQKQPVGKENAKEMGFKSVSRNDLESYKSNYKNFTFFIWDGDTFKQIGKYGNYEMPNIDPDSLGEMVKPGFKIDGSTEFDVKFVEQLPEYIEDVYYKSGRLWGSRAGKRKSKKSKKSRRQRKTRRSKR